MILDCLRSPKDVIFTKAFTGIVSHNERRRDKRKLAPPLSVSFDGRSYPSVDWSLGGVLVSDYYGPAAPGDEVEGQVQILTDPTSHAFKAVVVRRDSGSGELALNFTDLSDSAFSVLESALMGRYGL